MLEYLGIHHGVSFTVHTIPIIILWRTIVKSRVFVVAGAIVVIKAATIAWSGASIESTESGDKIIDVLWIEKHLKLLLKIRKVDMPELLKVIEDILPKRVKNWLS